MLLKTHTFVFHLFSSKVNQEAEPYSGAAEFVEQLSFVNRLIGHISFQFDDDFAGNEQVRSVVPHDHTLEFYFDFWFDFNLHPSRFQFDLHGTLINSFKESITKDIMN